MDSLEANSTITDLQLQTIDTQKHGTIPHLAHLQLQIEDLEDRNHGNNICIKGLPEAAPPAHLYDTILSIFSRLLDDTRVETWQLGTIDFDGTSIQMLPYLSRNTLCRKAILKPLMNRLCNVGTTYRWGYILHIIVRKDTDTFYLHSKADVAAFHDRLDIEPFYLSDWLGHLGKEDNFHPWNSGSFHPLPPCPSTVSSQRMREWPTTNEQWGSGCLFNPYAQSLCYLIPH